MSSVFVIPQVIYPQINGGKKIVLGRIFNLINQKKDIKIICFNSNNENVKEFKSFCSSYDIKLVIYTPKYALSKKNKIAHILNYAFSIFSFKTKYMQNINDKDFISILKENIKENDEVYYESIYFYDVYKKINLNNKSFFLFHNVESIFLSEISKLQKSILLKIAYKYESIRIEKLENKLFNLIKRKKVSYYFLTNYDKNYYIKKYNIINISDKLLLNNNDLFMESIIIRELDFERKILLFAGSIEFEPNFEALKWFNQNIFKELIKKYPKIKLVITGDFTLKNKSLIVDSSNTSIEFTGRVSEQVLHDLYSKCICMISPILSGSGIKVKNIEAIEYGIPVVMTQFSAIGLDLFKDHSNVYCSEDNSPDSYLRVLVKAIDEICKTK